MIRTKIKVILYKLCLWLTFVAMAAVCGTMIAIGFNKGW